jgi:hypothetical protein
VKRQAPGNDFSALFAAVALMTFVCSCSSYDSRYFVEIPKGTQPPTATATLPPPTSTSTAVQPTATVTQTPYLSPTPDRRILDADPRDLVLQEEDLPEEHGYFFNESTLISNRLITINYRAEGPQYLERTLRIEGWQVNFAGPRSANEEIPRDLSSSIEVFQSADGAQIALREFNVSTLGPLSGRYEIVDAQLGLGDEDLLLRRSFVERNQFHHTYVVGFAYRNVIVYITGTVFDFDESLLTYSFLWERAVTVLERLKTSPLAESSTNP